MKSWWAGLSFRDRMTLGIGAYALGLIIVWFGIVRPLAADNAQLRTSVAAAQREYTWMQRAAHEVNGLRASAGAQSEGADAGHTNKGGLLAQVNAGLASANLAGSLQNMRPDGDDKVYLVLKDCTYSALSKWLASLKREGVEVSEAQLSRRGADEVDARLSLKRGGG